MLDKREKMDRYQDDIARIRTVLSEHPKGMSITDISAMVGVNRNSVAKYMDILQIQGAVDGYRVGTSKLYFISSRLPASSVQKVCTRPFILIDKNGVITETSKAFSDNTGLSRDRTVGQTFETLPVTPAGSPALVAAFRSALRGMEQRIAGRITTPAGTHYAGTLLLEPVVFENGQPGAALIIDEQEHAVPRVEIHAAFSDILALLDDELEYVVRCAPDGTIRFVNETYCRAAGKTKEDLVNRPFKPLVSAQDAERIRNHRAGLTPKNPVAIIEYRVIMAEGEVSWQRWKDRALFSDRGELTGYQSCGTDITDSMSMRNQLAQSEEKMNETIRQRTMELREINRQLYAEIAKRETGESLLLQSRVIVDNIPSMVFLLNKKAHILYANKRAAESTGYPVEKLHSMAFVELFPHCGSEGWDSLVNLLKTSNHREQKLTMLRQGREQIPVKIIFRQLNYQGDDLVCCIAHEEDEPVPVPDRSGTANWSLPPQRKHIAKNPE